MRALILVCLMAVTGASAACDCEPPRNTDGGSALETVDVPFIMDMSIVVYDGDLVAHPWGGWVVGVWLRDVPDDPRYNYLFAYDPETGDGCELGQYDFRGANLPGPMDAPSHDVGDILITGTLQDPLVVTCMAYILTGERCWYDLEGEDPLLQAGGLLSVSFPGGPELGAFAGELPAPERPWITDPPGAMDGTPVPVAPGQPITLRWVPGDGDHILVSHGGEFVCRSDDDGEITIPAALASRIIPADVIPNRSIEIARIVTRTLPTEDGQLLRLRAWYETGLLTVTAE